MGLRMKNLNIFVVHWKIWFLDGWRIHEKKQYTGGNCLKGGPWTFCRFKGGLLGKKEGGGVFEGGWYPNAHYDEHTQTKT